jgi:hypothetical protein
MSRVLRYLTSALSGPAQARAAHRQALLRHPSIVEGIAQLQRALPIASAGDDDDPIFLLSAGWRSGSTLLQRLIMSDSRVLIWGEPYDECGMIQALAATMTAFRVEWPPAEYFYDGTAPDRLSGDWIANLFPSLRDLRDGHRALFDTTFAQPARRAGALRWGIKEVRLGIEHAAYLRWLYPRSRLIFLYRDPLSAFRSYSRHGRSWYDTFPDKPMFTASAFGTHWRRLMAGFLERAQQLDAMLLRYEDLVGEAPPIERIESHLGIGVDRAVLEDKVGSSEGRGGNVAVSRLDRWLLKRAVSPLATQVGYDCK